VKVLGESPGREVASTSSVILISARERGTDQGLRGAASPRAATT
jgi:hypothetical protein